MAFHSVDKVMLLNSLRDDLLEYFSTVLQKPLEGLSQGARLAKQNGLLSSKSAAKLIDIDFAYNFVRHVTMVKRDMYIRDIIAEVAGGKAHRDAATGGHEWVDDWYGDQTDARSLASTGAIGISTASSLPSTVGVFNIADEQSDNGIADDTNPGADLRDPQIDTGTQTAIALPEHDAMLCSLWTGCQGHYRHKYGVHALHIF